MTTTLEHPRPRRADGCDCDRQRDDADAGPSRRGLLRGAALGRRHHDVRLGAVTLDRPRWPRAARPAYADLDRRGALAARRRRRAVARRAARRPGVLRRPARASRVPAGRRWSPPTASSACTRRWRRCCRCGAPASSPRSTPPGCRSPTARTSPRWRSSRTPTPARRERIGWLNRLVGDDDGQLDRCRRSPSAPSIPTSMIGPEPVMAFGVPRHRELAGGDRASDPRGRG